MDIASAELTRPRTELFTVPTPGERSRPPFDRLLSDLHDDPPPREPDAAPREPEAARQSPADDRDRPAETGPADRGDAEKGETPPVSRADGDDQPKQGPAGTAAETAAGNRAPGAATAPQAVANPATATLQTPPVPTTLGATPESAPATGAALQVAAAQLAVAPQALSPTSGGQFEVTGKQQTQVSTPQPATGTATVLSVPTRSVAADTVDTAKRLIGDAGPDRQAEAALAKAAARLLERAAAPGARSQAGSGLPGVEAQAAAPTGAAAGSPDALISPTLPTAATSPVAASSVRAAVPAQGPAEQVAIQIHKAAVAGRERISVRLYPAELGRIEVKLELAGDGVLRAVISADKADTFELLQRDWRALERALQEAGLRTDDDSLSFDLRDRDGSGETDGEAGTAGEREAAGAGPDDRPDPAAAPHSGLHHGVLDLLV